jgi:hypothetical protein
MIYSHNILLKLITTPISLIDSFLYLHQNKQYYDHYPIALCISGCRI